MALHAHSTRRSAHSTALSRRVGAAFSRVGAAFSRVGAAFSPLGRSVDGHLAEFRPAVGVDGGVDDRRGRDEELREVGGRLLEVIARDVSDGGVVVKGLDQDVLVGVVEAA